MPASWTCIGLVETSSIACGIEVADRMAKASPATILASRPVTPGKHVTLFAGEVEEVTAALAVGREVAGGTLLDDLFLPRVDPQVIEAFIGKSPIGPIDALGVVETGTIASAIVAADAAAKRAAVRIVELRLGAGIGGKGLVILTGDVADVRQATSEGARAAERRGHLVREVVIAKADAVVGALLDAMRSETFEFRAWARPFAPAASRGGA